MTILTEKVRKRAKCGVTAEERVTAESLFWVCDDIDKGIPVDPVVMRVLEVCANYGTAAQDAGSPICIDGPVRYPSQSTPCVAPASCPIPTTGTIACMATQSHKVVSTAVPGSLVNVYLSAKNCGDKDGNILLRLYKNYPPELPALAHVEGNVPVGGTSKLATASFIMPDEPVVIGFLVGHNPSDGLGGYYWDYYDKVTINPGACTCTPWVDQGCISDTHRRFTRTCTPAGCDTETEDRPDPGCSTPCTCTPWVNAECTALGKRRQTRSCNPAGCDIEERIIDDASCEGEEKKPSWLGKHKIEILVVSGAVAIGATALYLRKKKK